MLAFTPLIPIYSHRRSYHPNLPTFLSPPASATSRLVPTMTIFNLGSINIDKIYSVPRIPTPGETLAATSLTSNLGGKGANLSAAASRAGGDVKHIGAVGDDDDGAWATVRLGASGVDVRHVSRVSVETGHAIIAVDEGGENAIIVRAGANALVTERLVVKALREAREGDWFVAQNETNFVGEAVRMARENGMIVGYVAAPFDAEVVENVVGELDFLILNQVEARQLETATGKGPAELGVKDVIVTRGGEGADWYGRGGKRRFQGLEVEAVDSTGAGDTFTGYVLAGLDEGMAMEDAIYLAMKAAALMVTRHGTADVIPNLDEVRAFEA